MFLMHCFSTVTNLLKFSDYGNNLLAQTIIKISSIQVISNSNNMRSDPGFFHKSIQYSCTPKYNLKSNLFLRIRFKIVIMG